MYSLVLVSLAAVAIPIINAQALNALPGLPACAQDAAAAGFAQTGCGLSDIKCICNASAFLISIQSAIEQKCDKDEQQAALAFAAVLCQSAGVVLPSALESPTPTTTTVSVSPESEVASSSESSAGTTSSLNVVAPSPVSNSASSSNLSTSPSSAAFSASSSSISSVSSVSSATSATSSSAPFTSSSVPTIPLPSSNSTSNTTVATSKPVPFKGDAGGISQSWLGLCVAIAGAAVVSWAL